MRFRLGLVIGFTIGYVLGAKAGQRRYEQIRSWWGSFTGSDAAQQLSSEVHDAATRAGHVIEEKASEGVSRVSEIVHREDRGSRSRAGRS